MQMRTLVRQAGLLWRAEMLVVELRLRLLARSTVLVLFAIFITLFGLAMLNVAAFQALQAVAGPVWSAVGIAFVDFLLAGIAVLVALRAKPGPELELAQDLRKLALEALEGEAATVQDFLTGASVGRLVSEPLQAMAPRLLVPLVGSIIRALRKKPEV
jgi:hypothetical protein